MELLITKIVEYKEKDAIINAFNDKENISILVKGILSNKSKNALLNNVFTLADIELSDKKTKFNVLKTSHIIFSPMSLISDITSLSMISILNELIEKCLTSEEKCFLYPDLLIFINLLKSKNKNIRLYFLMIIANILKCSGYSFNVNGCINCSSKKSIVAFSFEHGGFICSDCMSKYEEIDKHLTKEELLLIRCIFMGDLKNEYGIVINNDSFIKILRRMVVFIQDNYGIQIKNIELLL